MTENSKAAVIQKLRDFLGRSDYHPITARAIAKQLNVTKKGWPQLQELLEELVDSGEVQQNKAGLLRLRPRAGLIPGTIKKTSGGFGFLIPHPRDGEAKVPDVYIGREDIGDAHTGDEVLVQMLRRPPRDDGKLRGRVVEIVQRSTRTFVGTYLERDEHGFVQVDGSMFNLPVFVGDPGAKGAQPGDKVVFEMLRFPSQSRGGEGVLTTVLGPRGKPGVDTLSVIHEFGLPDEFPENVLEQARHQAQAFDEEDLHGRLDLTAETIVTIDPKDARDFDDAISLSQSENGHWHLGVHIADVAHFVRAGSALDKEAYRRGTSVYLPDRVLPMLPEVISNGLASLQQDKVRYTKSALMEFTREGVPVHAEFASSAIRVTRRFAYEEVMPIVQHPEQHKKKVDAKVLHLLSQMYELGMLLRARRFGAGSLELALPEVKIDINTDGKVSGAHVAHHDASHEIIEEFMLAANMAVATALNDRSLPFLRRVHGDPDEAKMRAFGEFVTSLGFPLKRFQSRPDLQRLLDQVQGTPQAHAVNYALLRSLKQAEYTPEPLGHYALAADDYCHFTSPIRRYPDLTIHRLIDVLATKNSETPVPGVQELAMLGQHCSRTERRAEQAERELVKAKLLTYMADRVGEEYSAIITGVQEFGFFCQAIEIPAEGLVHVSSLDDDFYYLDSAVHSLIGRQSGRQYRLGDEVRVKVARVDVDRRQLDFRLASSRSGQAVQRETKRPGDGKPPRKPHPGKGGPPERKSGGKKGKSQVKKKKRKR